MTMFRFWNMAASVVVFLVLPAPLDLLPIGWLLLSSIAGSVEMNRPAT